MVISAIGAASAGEIAAGIGAASTVLQVGGSLLASGQQQQAAGQATGLQEQYYNSELQNLGPYMATGQAANTNLQTLTGQGTANPLTSPLLQPITMSEQNLQKTPGYQFNLQQGLESVQNSAAARGLGASGAAEKGAASYATGLADNTYQNQFNNALTNQNNQFNRLLGLTQLGQTSAAGVGAAGITTGQGAAQTTLAGGQAAAAGTLGAANALSSAYPNYLSNNALSSLYGSNSYGGQGAASAYVNSSPQQQVAQDIAESSPA